MLRYDVYMGLGEESYFIKAIDRDLKGVGL